MEFRSRTYVEVVKALQLFKEPTISSLVQTNYSESTPKFQVKNVISLAFQTVKEKMEWTRKGHISFLV